MYYNSISDAPKRLAPLVNISITILNYHEFMIFKNHPRFRNSYFVQKISINLQISSFWASHHIWNYTFFDLWQNHASFYKPAVSDINAIDREVINVSISLVSIKNK